MHIHTSISPANRDSNSIRDWIPYTPVYAIDIQRQLRSIGKLLSENIIATEYFREQIQQLAKDFQQEKHKNTIQEREIHSLRANNAHQTKNRFHKDRQLAWDGGYNGIDAQKRLQIEAEMDNYIDAAPPRPAESANQRPRQRCGLCRMTGHKRNRCPGVSSTS